MLLPPLLPIFTIQVSQAVLFQLVLNEQNWFLFIRRTQFTIKIIIAQSQSCQLYLNLSRDMWQNRISGTSLQTILFIETSRLIVHTIRVKLCSWTLPITGLRLWTLESLWVQCCWILAKRLTLWIMTYCYPKLTNIMSRIHLKSGFNHTLVIKHNVAHCLSVSLAHCLIHWCWPEEFRKDQFWAQYYSRCTSMTFQLEYPTQMSTYMQMTLPYGRLTVTRCAAYSAQYSRQPWQN